MIDLVEKLKVEGLLLATNNTHKIKEFQRLLNPLSINVESISDAGFILDVEETAPDFAGNCAIKAREGFRLSNRPCIADDSGLCVDFLKGEPGVFSARYGSPDWSDRKRTEFLLQNMQGVAQEDRGAHFICVLALCYGPGQADVNYFQGQVDGLVATQVLGENGFGYDPVFIEPTSGLSFAQITPQEKDAISHRGRALQDFMTSLQ